MRLDGLHVLVLEDDYFLADDARLILESAGAAVVGPCHSAEAAFRALDAQAVDCAMVDINLGDGPSFKTAFALTERGIPIVLVTGYDRNMVPSELSHVPCLLKPADPRKIVETIGRACAAARVTQGAI